MLTIDTIAAPEFPRQRPVWEAVLSPQASFFLSYDWFTCCVQRLAAEDEPCVLVVRDGTDPVGIVPLVQTRTTWRIFPVRVITVMETPDSPVGGIAARPGATTAVLDAVLDHLSRRKDWHVFAIPKIDQASPLGGEIAALMRSRACLRRPAARSPILDMTAGWEAYWHAQSQRFKKTVRNVANRVERLGRIEIDDLAASADAATCVAVFRDVAARAWKASLPTSPTTSPTVARFFDALTAVLHQRRQLAFWVLRLNGTPIATEYHVHDGDTVYALRSDFDEQYREASPGAHLNATIVRTYFDRGVRLYDMGPGDSEYKQRWATAVREFETFWVFKQAPYGLSLYTIDHRIVPQLRRIRGWWQRRTPPPERVGAHASTSLARTDARNPAPRAKI